MAVPRIFHRQCPQEKHARLTAGRQAHSCAGASRRIGAWRTYSRCMSPATSRSSRKAADRQAASGRFRAAVARHLAQTSGRK